MQLCPYNLIICADNIKSYGKLVTDVKTLNIKLENCIIIA